MRLENGQVLDATLLDEARDWGKVWLRARLFSACQNDTRMTVVHFMRMLQICNVKW